MKKKSSQYLFSLQRCDCLKIGVGPSDVYLAAHRAAAGGSNPGPTDPGDGLSAMVRCKEDQIVPERLYKTYFCSFWLPQFVVAEGHNI